MTQMQPGSTTEEGKSPFLPKTEKEEAKAKAHTQVQAKATQKAESKTMTMYGIDARVSPPAFLNKFNKEPSLRGGRKMEGSAVALLPWERTRKII
jgi:hypothetical protein